MNKVIIPIFALIFTACIYPSKQCNDHLFYDTLHEYREDLCAAHRNWVYKLDSSKVIYACHDYTAQTTFIIADHDLESEYDRISFLQTRLHNWVMDYENTHIVGVGSRDQVQLIRINVLDKTLEWIADLPNDNYWFSEHPISKNNRIVFHSKEKILCYDLDAKKMVKQVDVRCTGAPVISKDGSNFLYVNSGKVYLGYLNTDRVDKLLNPAPLRNYRVIDAFFGSGESVIVKGVINFGVKALEQVEYRTIRNGKVEGTCEIKVKKGLRYH